MAISTQVKNRHLASTVEVVESLIQAEAALSRVAYGLLGRRDLLLTHPDSDLLEHLDELQSLIEISRQVLGDSPALPFSTSH